MIDFSILILDIVKAQILADETSKLFEFFLTELSTFFENLTEECPQRLWEEILSFLTVGLQNKTVTSKHYDKRRPASPSLQDRLDGRQPQDPDTHQVRDDPVRRAAGSVPR